MSSKHTTISAMGLENLSLSHREQDFTFIIGNQSFHCNSLFAEFISPIIAKERISDPFMDYFRLNVLEDKDSFSQLLSLYTGEHLNITNKNALFFEKVGYQLGNHELVDLAFQVNEKKLSTENAIDRAIAKFSFGGQIDEETDFIASHFTSFTSQELQKLPPEVLLSVMLTNSLQIPSEDFLFNIIMEHVKKGENHYKVLFDYISFDFLSSTALKEFFEYIKLEDFTEDILDSLRRRLVDQKDRTEKKMNTPDDFVGDFPVSEENAFHGIFANFAEKLEKNPHAASEIIVSSSSSIFNQPEQVMNFGWGSSWNTANLPKSWIQFDFKDRLVAIEGYSIQTNRGGRNSCHLKNWNLEGSMDGQKWSKIDERKDDTFLNGSHLIHTYSCKKSPEFHFIRLVQTGKTHRGDNYICIGQMELFGTVSH